MIHLDTSFLIRSLVAGSAEDARLRAWIGARESLVMSSIAWTEFLCGPVDANAIRLAQVVVTERAAYTENQARLAATLFNESGRRRGAMIDCMIAAAAMDAQSPLATANQTDFKRFAALGLALA